MRRCKDAPLHGHGTIFQRLEQWGADAGGKGRYKRMFTDIYVSIQASQVLQDRWLKEATQTRSNRLSDRVRRALTRK